MKTVFAAFLLLICGQFVSAQQANRADPPHEPIKKSENFTLQRLFIFNDKNEILVIKQKGNWTTPALRHDGAQSIKEALDGLAATYGITITEPTLRGQVVFKYEDSAMISLRNQYTVNLKAGNLITPHDVEETKWLPVTKAIEIISFPSLQAILKQITASPQTIWGGTFLMSRKDGKQNFKMLEDFYPLFQSSGLPEVYSPLIQLTIVNDKNEILMRKTEFGWMTLAQRFYSKQNIHEFVVSMAQKYGIKISAPRLAGLFTYKYTFKNNADTRQFYLAHYIEGKISPPSGEEVMWLPKSEAIEKLKSTVESLGTTTDKILTYPETIWGGSFLLNRVEGKLKSEVDEDFYSLTSNLGIRNKK